MGLGAIMVAAPRTHEREAELADLLERVASGDGQALSQLYDQTHRLIYCLALRVLREPSAAEDVTVETFSNVWRSAGSFDRKRGNASGWLFMLVRNRAIDRCRCESRHRCERLEAAGEIAWNGHSPEESELIRQQRLAVRRCMDSLDTRQRQAIELAYFEGLSHSEIAARLCEPLGTIKARVRRGMMRLREQLEQVL